MVVNINLCKLVVCNEILKLSNTIIIAVYFNCLYVYFIFCVNSLYLPINFNF